MRVLLVEDDRMIGEAVLDALRADHWAVDWVRDAAMADAALAGEALRRRRAGPRPAQGQRPGRALAAARARQPGAGAGGHGA